MLLSDRCGRSDAGADGRDLSPPPLQFSDAITEILDPESYVQSQALAERLVDAGALGVVYPSVRRAGGTCLACFRPALVMNVRKSATYRLRWIGGPIPEIERVGPALP